MASPHTAGLVALIWSAFPALVRDVPNTERKLRPATLILNATAACGGDGPRTHPNNQFGAGRADAFRAINFFDVYTNQANYQAGDSAQDVPVDHQPAGGAAVGRPVSLPAHTALDRSVVPARERGDRAGHEGLRRPDREHDCSGDGRGELRVGRDCGDAGREPDQSGRSNQPGHRDLQRPLRQRVGRVRLRSRIIERATARPGLLSFDPSQSRSAPPPGPAPLPESREKAPSPSTTPI